MALFGRVKKKKSEQLLSRKRAKKRLSPLALQLFIGILLAFQASAGIDFLKTDLEEFTWGGQTPDDTLAAIASFALRGEF